ncbi:MAG: energy transducer TonB [Desulfovibrionales bacterium]|nr:energy transducer TonB [Desulfovibrionales bacterium]
MTARQLLGVCLAVSILCHWWIFQLDWTQNSDAATSEHVIALDFDIPQRSLGDTLSITAGIDSPTDGEKSEDAARRLKRLATKQYLAKVTEAIEHRKFSSTTDDLSDVIGNVRYSFHIEPDDSFTDIRLIRSSGDLRLDAAARNAIELASGTTKRPNILRNQRFAVSITIKYQYSM